MKTGRIPLATVLLACLFCIFDSVAHAADQGPENVVRDFYTWYAPLVEKNSEDPFESEDIYKYVYHCTVENLRTRYAMGMIDWDYFLCGQEVDPELLTDLTVHKAVPVTGALSLVAVGGKEKPYILAFVQKEKDGWRITKIEDARLFPGWHRFGRHE